MQFNHKLRYLNTKATDINTKVKVITNETKQPGLIKQKSY